MVNVSDYKRCTPSIQPVFCGRKFFPIDWGFVPLSHGACMEFKRINCSSSSPDVKLLCLL